MGPIEILWLAIVVFFIFIALVRGYPKELGVTAVIFTALFLIAFFLERYLPQLVKLLSKTLGMNPSARGLEHFYSLFYSAIFLLILFSAYAGQTFAFQASERKGAEGATINLLVGLLNGCLVAGALWYFQDKFNYPITDLKNAAGQPLLLKLPLTALAQWLSTLLPLKAVPGYFWGALLMLMLLARVRR